MPLGRGIRKAQSEETKASLIAAARRLFAQNGFHATGTHEIVTEAGVTRGALQHHFSKKEDLFLAVFKQVEDDMADGSSGKVFEHVGDKWLALRENLSAYLESATTPEVQRIILLDGPAVLGWSEWRRLESHYGLGSIAAAVADGIAAGYIRAQPPAPLACMILSALNEAALMIANSNRPRKAKREADFALQTLLNSLS